MQARRAIPLPLLLPAILAASLTSAVSAEGDVPAVRQPPETVEAVKQFRQLGYGMFIHFGMSTFSGQEIDPGHHPSQRYNPTELDVEQWARVAHDAGMKYIVLTSKHVSGHCLWDSKVQYRGKEYDYDVATSGNKTDVVAALLAACKKYDLKLGLYWCMLDNHNKNATPGASVWKSYVLRDEFFQLMQDQLAELMARYPEIEYYWLDIPRAASVEQRATIYRQIKQRNPACIVLYNYGIVQPQGEITIEKIYKDAYPTDVFNSERSTYQPGQFTPTHTFRGETWETAYEHCGTIGRHWFWVPGDKPLPISHLARVYEQVRKAGGNLLLNVPPDRRGVIPREHIDALMELKDAIDGVGAYAQSLTTGRPVEASNVYQNDPRWAGKFAVDGAFGSRWATDDDVEKAWLAVDLGKPTTVARAAIYQAYPNLDRIRGFRIEYKDGDQWKTAYTGGRVGEEVEVSFPPVTARFVRLNITESTGGPTTWEFDLLPEADGGQ